MTVLGIQKVDEIQAYLVISWIELDPFAYIFPWLMVSMTSNKRGRCLPGTEIGGLFFDPAIIPPKKKGM
jgi:hypothetical protein